MGEQYLQVLAFAGDSVPSEYGVTDRTLGDTVDPYRPGSAMEVVNAVTRAVGSDAAGWSWVRLVAFVSGLEREYAGVEG